MKTVTSADGLAQQLLSEGYELFVGVPDSGLRGFIEELDALPVQHVIATWEAEAVAIAAGAELAGRKACVYLQNAGLGHAVNPLASLCIPWGLTPLLVIGHRHTLPQHAVMGRVDVALLELLDYPHAIVVHGPNNES
ncbi:MAG: aepY [Frankiales bacterium]|jgi:sulfopyruvate decarboxylase TPP-binding subunit|nr:aepY [Frankiales bacterium]